MVALLIAASMGLLVTLVGTPVLIRAFQARGTISNTANAVGGEASSTTPSIDHSRLPSRLVPTNRSPGVIHSTFTHSGDHSPVRVIERERRVEGDKGSARPRRQARVWRDDASPEDRQSSNLPARYAGRA